MTKLDGIFSDPKSVTCDVPQGSILGPLLFTLYVNDLPNANPDLNTYLYADDTAIVVSSDNFADIEAKLNIALKNIASYFVRNKLSLNCTKSRLHVLGHPR